MKKLALIAAAGIVLMAGSAHAQVAGRGGHPGGGHPGGGHGPRPGGGHNGGHGGGWNGGNWGGGFNHRGFGNGSFFGGFGFGGFFQQPQYHVQNWQLYGFVNPGPQRQWIRYYDDAYLVDQRGYVHDSRRRMDWDRYGERWQRDQQGIPYYVGRGDYRPRRDERGRGGDYGVCGGPDGRGHPACGDDRHGGYDREDNGYDREDYGYDREEYRGHDGYDGEERHVRVEHHGEGHDGYDRGGDVRTRVYSVPGGACGSGCSGYSGSSSYGNYGAGYGYGHGGYGAGTVIVTETTVTPGEVVTEEIIEEVIEERGHVRHRRAAPRRAAPPPRRRAPAPAPRVYLPRGDRG